MRRPAGSWSNDQLSSAFTAPAARLSSRTVQQNQKWSPELPYSSRTGPAQQRADEQQKAATSPLQPRLQGQKISQGVIKGYRGGQPAHPGVGGAAPPHPSRGGRPPARRTPTPLHSRAAMPTPRGRRHAGPASRPRGAPHWYVRHIRTIASYDASRLALRASWTSRWLAAPNRLHCKSTPCTEALLYSCTSRSDGLSAHRPHPGFGAWHLVSDCV